MSVQHAMGITLGFDVQETGVGPLSNPALEPRRSLTFECDIAHTRQLHSHSRLSSSHSAQQTHTSSTHTLKPSNIPHHLQAFVEQHDIKTNYRTPLNIPALTHELEAHPNHSFVHKFIHNLSKIGYNGPELTLISNNLQSAYHQPSIIAASIAKECKEGRILGPFSHPLCLIFAPLALAWFPNMIVDGEQYATCLHLVTTALMPISIQSLFAQTTGIYLGCNGKRNFTSIPFYLLVCVQRHS